jgi:membrane associated rhomboid family serine protease
MAALPWTIWVLLGLCIVPGLVLQGADLGWWGTAQWRGLAYAWGGFWPGLLHDWQPNYRLQPWAMFVTYGFLHSGISHLTVNMISLVSLGRMAVDRLGQGGFTGLYILSLLGGGAGFGLLTNTTVPMVGASGALFGLAGAWLVWEFLDRRREALGLWPVARALIWFIVLNILLLWAAAGQLAWQTHLGGFLAGAVVAWGLDKRCGRPNLDV